jgi:uncharacterized protein
MLCFTVLCVNIFLMENTIDFNLIKPLFQAGDVMFAGVFGSVARGEAKKDSDVDILVRFKKPTSLLGIIHLERIISEKLGREVDLVTENSLSPLIKKDVFRDLKPIYGER